MMRLRLCDNESVRIEGFDSFPAVLDVAKVSNMQAYEAYTFMANSTNTNMIHGIIVIKNKYEVRLVTYNRYIDEPAPVRLDKSDEVIWKWEQESEER